MDWYACLGLAVTPAAWRDGSVMEPRRWFWRYSSGARGVTLDEDGWSCALVRPFCMLSWTWAFAASLLYAPGPGNGK